MLDVGETKESSAPNVDFVRLPLHEPISDTRKFESDCFCSRRFAPMYFACSVFTVVVVILFFFTTHKEQHQLIFLYRDAGEFYGLYPVQLKLLEEQKKQQLHNDQKLMITVIKVINTGHSINGHKL